jgi:hypothetical protein
MKNPSVKNRVVPALTKTSRLVPRSVLPPSFVQLATKVSREPLPSAALLETHQVVVQNKGWWGWDMRNQLLPTESEAQ